MSGSTLLVLALVAGVGLVALFVASRRAVTLCDLEVRGGTLHVRRGGLAPRILADLEDVTRRSGAKDGTIRVLREGEHARLEVSGELDEATRQRIRNVVGSVPLAKLINARVRR